jgi:hypothetical protein
MVGLIKQIDLQEMGHLMAICSLLLCTLWLLSLAVACWQTMNLVTHFSVTASSRSASFVVQIVSFCQLKPLHVDNVDTPYFFVGHEAFS